MKQSDAVRQAIAQIKDIDGKVTLTEPEREQVVAVITKGLENGSIELSERARAKYEGKMKTYASALVSNGLKKDKQLNGGEPWKPKNPGSRSGSGDEQIKALKALLTTLDSGDERVPLIEAKIEERREELRKAKQVQPDLSVLDPEFVKLLQLTAEAE